MMDFLHRLAPPRETDASRAVAVLPSRFAGDSPLRAAIGQPRPMQRMDDEDSSVSLDAAPAPDTEHGPAQYPARAHSTRPEVLGSSPSPVGEDDAELSSDDLPSPLLATKSGSGPTSARQPSRPAAADRAHERVTPESPRIDRPTADDEPPTTLERTRDTRVSRPAGVPAAKFVEPERILQTRRPDARIAQHGVTSALADVTSVTRPLPRARVTASPLAVVSPVAAAATTLPLSDAAVAARAPKSGAQHPVVHVTIGRIDVVANTAPAPAVRRSPTPRQGTVTLADYLRDGNGSHR